MANQRSIRELNMTTRAMRSPSLSSDVPSTLSAATPALPEANPPPSFVASAEASQLVSSEVGHTVNVKSQALVLLNSFLDHILYNILSTAKSIQLARLREAVPVVLKPRLGKAALEAADEELKEYLNDGDDEILIGNDPRPEPGKNFDLDLAWKLARLRCMVYTRLGDMEEEDEEEHIESEQLHPGSGAYTNAAHRASSVKAASAIFLTSILEYLGEQALLYAVQNTQRRAQAPRPPVALQVDESGPMSSLLNQNMLLDESDMFHVGRESPLSRLWRSWRRQTRLPMEVASRQISPTQDEHSPVADRTPRIDRSAVPEDAVPEDIEESNLPHQIPLPMSNNDVNEIEVPGLAREIMDDDDVQPTTPMPEHIKKRPASMVINNSDSAYQSSPDFPRTMVVQEKRMLRPSLDHKRSMSHPTPEKQKYTRMANTDSPDTKSAEGAQVADATDHASSQNATSNASTEAAPGLSIVQDEEEKEHNEGHATSGLVATVVSAAAGALGFQGLASVTSKDKHKEKESVEHHTTPAKTAAEEMLGSTPRVPLPKDAVTGSSIKSVDDFDNLNMPMGKRNMSETQDMNSKLDSSDPEDLALSSADEDASDREHGVPVVASKSVLDGASSHKPSLLHNSEVFDATVPAAGTLDHQTRVSKASNRQGIFFDASQVQSNEGATITDSAEPDRTMYVPVNANTTPDLRSSNEHITAPVASLSSPTKTVVNKSAMSPTFFQAESDVVRAPVTSRPSTATTTIHSSVPPRLSSDRGGSGHAHTDSKTSQYSQDSKGSSTSSKLLGFTRDHEGRPQTGTAYAPILNSMHDYPDRSTGGVGEVRSDNSSFLKKPLKVETRAGTDRGIDHAEAKKKSLEILIRGDETLHYTLTPVSARAENFPLPGHSPDAARNLSSRDHFSAGHQPTSPGKSNTITGFRANPATEGSSVLVGGSALSTFTQAKLRTNRAQPRDARLDNTTMMDLADYARSTGPENEQQLPKALSSRPGTSTTVKTTKSSSNTIRTTPAPRIPTTRPTTQQSESSKSVGARARFQARDPTVSRRSGTNDLIEFLREGPPADAVGLSSQTSSGNGRASAASTQYSSVAPRSIQESMSSSTALLDSNRAQAKNVVGVTSEYRSAGGNAPAPQRNGMPARKQHRVRDPYAIDDSDDDLEEQHTAAHAKRSQDESLIDFLRNTAPPPGSSPPAILAGPSNASSAAAAAGSVKRQSSTQGIRERIMRSASRSSLTRKGSVNHSQPATSNDDSRTYYRSGGNARDTSPHLVQTGKKIDAYKPTTVTHAAHVDRNRSHMKARGPTSSSRTGTADLADYLKNSGPPDVPAAQVRQPNIVREEAGFLKFFSRRKAVNAK